MKIFRVVAGFHLIELLIVVSIIAILVGISVPVYSRYLVRERRLEAVGMLAKLAVGMERYEILHGSYLGASVGELGLAEAVGKEGYQFSVRMMSEGGYLLVARPVGEKDDCGELSLDSKGRKGITGTGDMKECWGA